jgi:hypothetical protein
MGANLDAMLLGQSHGLAHVIEVRGMESASDVGDVNMGHQPFVVAHPVEAVGFAHVAIDHDHLPFSLCQLPHPSAAFANRPENPPNEAPADFNRRQVRGDRPKQTKAAAGTQPRGGTLPAYLDTR